MNSFESFALWPITPFGAEGEGGGSGEGGNSGQSNGSTDSNAGSGQENSGANDSGNDSGNGNDGAAGNKDSDEEDDEYEGYSAKELKRIAKDKADEAREAKKEAKRLKDKDDAEERKKNDDVTNLTKDVADRDQTIAALRATVTKQAIEGAIRDDDRYIFHDVEMVASVATKINPDITVSDDGKVEGLKATLPKVAKQHDFMVKSTKESGDGKNGTNNGGGQQNNGPTGFQPGQGGTSGGSGDDPDAKKLAEHYPALALRG